jgi:hypothetical protein
MLDGQGGEAGRENGRRRAAAAAAKKFRLRVENRSHLLASLC